MDYDGKVRYYYTDERGKNGYKDSYWSLAISDDGLKFTRPSLGLVEFRGSKDNNIIFNGRQGSLTGTPIREQTRGPFSSSRDGSLTRERW